MLDLATDSAAMPRVPGFTPQYVDYRTGFDQVIEAWQQPR
jgi:hypothetical protein